MKKLIIALVLLGHVFQAAVTFAAPPAQGLGCLPKGEALWVYSSKENRMFAQERATKSGVWCYDGRSTAVSNGAEVVTFWVVVTTSGDFRFTDVPPTSSEDAATPTPVPAATATPAPAATSALPASELIRSLTNFSKSCSLKKEVWLQLMQASGCCSKPAEILIVGDGSFTSTGDQSGVIPMGDYYQVELGTVTDWLSFPSTEGYDGSVAQTLAGEDLINWIWLQESQHVIQWDKSKMSSFKKEEDACKFANENWQKWRLAECNFPPAVATAASTQSSPSGGDWCTQKGGTWILRPNGANPYWACHTGP